MITAFAPATVSNLNCGFDILGLAIDRPGDEVSVVFNDKKEIQIIDIQGDNGKLPYTAAKNTAGAAVISLCQHLGVDRGIDIAIHKKMPFGSGLGSSAASAVAAAVATNALLGSPLSKRELLPFVLDGEAVASGARHADNAAPSLLGGLVLIKEYRPLEVLDLPVPDQLYCTVIHPHVEILTKEARNILPKQVSLKDAITQTGNVAAFVAALFQNNLPLLSRCMTDLFAEPYRAQLIPEFLRVRNAALYGGALAFGISGSGPSMFAFSDGHSKSQQIGELMQKTLTSKNITATVYNSKINQMGARILHQ